MSENKKTLQEYLDFNYSELDLSTLELANAKRLVMCIKPSLKKLNSLERRYNAAKKEFEDEQAFQESILDTYTSGLDKLIEKGKVIEATLPQGSEIGQSSTQEDYATPSAQFTGTTEDSTSNSTDSSDPIENILNPFS